MKKKRRTSLVKQMLALLFMPALALAVQGDGGGDGSGDHGEGNPDATRPGMFRKNVSRTPEMVSSKSKLNTMRVWFPALKADDSPAVFPYYDPDLEETVERSGIPYYDYTCVETDEETKECLTWERNLIKVAEEAKPIVVVYTDGVDTDGLQEPVCEDVFAAISRDDGKTFKRKNLSRMADNSSFKRENGEEFCGQVKKPVFQVNDNNILVAWTSKFCKGGKPTYAIDKGDEYSYDDPYYEDDIWGVSGPQKSVDYTEGTGPIPDFPDVGEVPYSCVWTARGTIVTQEMIDGSAYWSQYQEGEIVWYKPERLTSGRRDAIQAFMGKGEGAGFGLIWQEDPAGLRPGKMAGPGMGWSGATVHHKTDIWYSYIPQEQFRKVDLNFESGGDPEHEVKDKDEDGVDDIFIERPKALVPMSLPIRLSDNDVVNTDSMKVELYDNGYPVVDADGNFVPLDGSSSVSQVSYLEDNLTRCVKFEEGKTIVETTSSEAADYKVLPALPADHKSSMNCTNCHAPFDTESGSGPDQAAPLPLVVVDADAPEYLGGFTNSDCVSCHYSHIVPRDRVIMASNEADCTDKGGAWDQSITAYYPYEGYPYIADADDDASGTHRYGYMLDGMCNTYKDSVIAAGGNGTTAISWENVDLSNWYDFINNQDVAKRVLVTDDQRLLDGDTGASRPNLFMQPFTKPDGSKSAWAIIAYEETKGVGSGPPLNAGEKDKVEDQEQGGGDDRYFPDNGKNVIYHSFEYTNPEKVSAGNIVNLPEKDDVGNLIYLYEVQRDGDGVPLTDEEGNFIPTNPLELMYDFQGNQQLAYENARRPRFIMQGKSAIGDSRTIMAMLYKEGQDGMGRQSDIMLRRFVVPQGQTGNPYRFSNMLADVQNMSSAEIGDTWTNPEAEPDAKGDQTKVINWYQRVENLNDKSSTNPYDDARAHRGAIRGDFLVMGYSWTPNWASARNAHDKYDFYVRRSFDGGQNWTTDPDGEGTTHVDTFKYYTDTETESEEDENGREKYDVTTTFGSGEFEPALNISKLPNNKETVIEPRIVGTPGTIKDTVTGEWNGIPEDKQNKNVYYLTFGTATNVPKPHGSSDDEAEELEASAPADLFYTFTQDRGETLVESSWVVQGTPTGDNAPETGDTVTGWDWLAKDKSVEYEQGEAQIRMTGDGSRFYATWLQEGVEESDIWFRRIMPSQFAVNVSKVISGFTVDEDDSTPLAGVEVQLYNNVEELNLTTVSDAEGYFVFEALDEGPYTVSVDESVFEEPAIFVALDSETPKEQVRFKKGAGAASTLTGDFDLDGDVDRNDVYVLQPYLNQPATSYPEGDIDNDGTITILDMRTLMGMCTCPACVCP